MMQMPLIRHLATSLIQNVSHIALLVMSRDNAVLKICIKCSLRYVCGYKTTVIFVLIFNAVSNESFSLEKRNPEIKLLAFKKNRNCLYGQKRSARGTEGNVREEGFLIILLTGMLVIFHCHSFFTSVK